MRASLDSLSVPRRAVVTTGSIALFVLAGCSGDAARREFGDQYVPGPDTLANVGAGDGAAEDDGDVDEGGNPGEDDAGAVDDSAADDSADDSAADDSAADAGADGADDAMDGDPLDDGGDIPPDSPYIGGWDIGTCQDDIVGTGTAVGDVLPDFNLTDQFGDTVRLYDFCHKAVWLISGAFW